MQWVSYGMTIDELQAHVRTFADVFPEVLVLRSPGNYGFFVLGSDQPMALEDRSVREVLARPGILEDISGAYDSPAKTADGWAALIPSLPWLTGAQVASFAGSGPLVTDDRPLPEYFLLRRTFGEKSPLVSPAEPRRGRVPVALIEWVTGTGQVFTILSEFGDVGAAASSAALPGPLHNKIAEPDRTVDNSTHWVADFNHAYYQDLFFGTGESFADFYTKQSSGNYTVAGGVSDWVQVPGNASTYGDNTVEDFGGAWQFIEDSGNAWYHGAAARQQVRRRDQGLPRAVRRLGPLRLRQRRQLRRAGRVHRSLPDGPRRRGRGRRRRRPGRRRHLVAPLVRQRDRLRHDRPDRRRHGRPVRRRRRSATPGYWIGDYTVEAENGGLGVFAHEFGHDLGLPDFYDTNAGENSTAFWTLMSSGSWQQPRHRRHRHDPGPLRPVGEAPARLARLQRREPGRVAAHTRSARPRSRPRARTRRSSSTWPTRASPPTTRRRTAATPGGRPARTTSTRR